MSIAYDTNGMNMIKNADKHTKKDRGKAHRQTEIKGKM